MRIAKEDSCWWSCGNYCRGKWNIVGGVILMGFIYSILCPCVVISMSLSARNQTFYRLSHNKAIRYQWKMFPLRAISRHSTPSQNWSKKKKSASWEYHWGNHWDIQIQKTWEKNIQFHRAVSFIIAKFCHYDFLFFSYK